MKKNIFILLIIVSLYGCESKNKIFTKEQTDIIESNYRKDSLNINFSFDLVYTTGLNDSIYISNYHELLNLYRISYIDSYVNYSSFLYDVLNQKKIVHICGVSYLDCFSLDSAVMNFYYKNGFEKIIEKYCIYQSKTETYQSKDKIRVTDLYTVSYILYLNGFYSHISDNVLKITYHRIPVSRNATTPD